MADAERGCVVRIIPSKRRLLRHLFNLTVLANGLGNVVIGTSFGIAMYEPERLFGSRTDLDAIALFYISLSVFVAFNAAMWYCSEKCLLLCIKAKHDSFPNPHSPPAEPPSGHEGATPP